MRQVGWSPDGQSVVYSSDNQIYTYNVALGTTPRQLTFDGINVFPAFSPDGTHVAFSSQRDGTDVFDLFVKNLDDDSPPRSIITLDGSQLMRQWPSDELIVFGRGAGGVRDLWMVNLSDPDNPQAEAYLSSGADLWWNAISPDGTLAAYHSNESGQYEVYVRGFPEPGERTVVSEGGGADSGWPPDGDTLYYMRRDEPEATFMAARIQREPTPVVVSTDSLFTVSRASWADLHPAGDRWIITQDVGSPDSGGATVAPGRINVVTNWFQELTERVPVP